VTKHAYLFAGSAAVALLLAATAVALGGGTTTPPPQPTATPVPPRTTATVTVDAGKDLGTLNNPADYHNQSGPAWLLGPADVTRVAALRPKVVRAWIKPHHYYVAETGEFRFDYLTESGTTVYQYLDQVAAHSDTIVGNFDQCAQDLMRRSDPTECRRVLKAGLLHYKKRYPTLRYIELFNEPDKTWEPSRIEQPAIALDDYYRWYQVGYEVVREVNEELRPELPLEIGGPATYMFNEKYLRGFLDKYAADTNPAKQLAFISYHQYRERARPAVVAKERDTVRDWLAERRLNPDRRIFVTEYGVFPGANKGRTFEADLLVQAAAMATLGRYYTYSGIDMAMHWTYDHLDNERKSMLVDETDGGVYPYYNLVLMQRMLRSRLLPAESTAVDKAGIGVTATASRDDRSVAVLVTNYQWTEGHDAHDVELVVDNLPEVIAGRSVTVERYLVDSRTSNWVHDPASAELQRVENRRAQVGTGTRLSFHLEPNAMTLVVLTVNR